MGNFLTIARFFTILITPSAKVTVTTMGRPSGIAATARLKRRAMMQHLKGRNLHYTSSDMPLGNIRLCAELIKDIPDAYGEHV